MKFIVTADWHWCNALPYSVLDWDTGVTDRMLDIRRMAKYIAALGQKHGAEGLLILGDYFDRKLLDAVTLTAASQTMRRLAKSFTQIWVLPGNHESHDARLIHFTNKWLEAVRGVKVPTEPVTIPDSRIRLYPYAPVPQLRKTLEADRANGKGLAGCLHTTFKGAAEYGHTFKDGLLSSDVKHFDLVLSGHVHTKQKLEGVKRGWYVGSPLPIDFRDEGTKCVWMLDGNTLELSAIPLPSVVTVPFRTIEVDLFDDGSIKDLAERLPEAVGYLRVTIRGTKHAVRKFSDRLIPKLSNTGFRRVVADERIVRTESKVRSKEMAEGRSDLRKSLTIWLDSLTMPEGADRKALLRYGTEVLDKAIAESRTVTSKRCHVELEHLTIQDFGPIGSADLDLKRAGLVSVRADNRDSAAADSNGAGKTTLFKAITWALYGKTIYRNETGNALVRQGSKGAKVTLTFSVDGEQVKVTREKPTSSSATLIIERGGKALAGGVNELQDEALRIVGLDFDTFRNTVLFGQNDTKRFADPAATDATRKAILRDVLGLGVFDVARDACAKAGRAIVDELDVLQRQEAGLTGRRDSNRLTELRGLSADWKDTHELEVKRLQDEAAEMEAEAAAIKADPGRAEKRVQSIEETLTNLMESSSKLDKELSAVREDCERALKVSAGKQGLLRGGIKSLTQRLEQMTNGICPVCFSDLSKGEAAKHKTEFKDELELLRGQLADIEAKDAELEKQRDKKLSAESGERDKLDQKAAQARSDLLESKSALRKATDAKAEADALRRSAAQKQDEARRSKDAVNPYTALIREAKAELETIDKGLKLLGTKMSVLNAEKLMAEFWSDGFGATGVQSWMMDIIADPLNDRANAYLQTLSDGDIKISIDTVSHTKSGEARDKFSITAEVEHNGETAPSGGQMRKIELAVELSLMDLVAEREGANVDLLCLDEVFDGLDATGKTRVLWLLDELRKTKGTILVVSHDADVKGSFDNVWTVVKDGGVSSVVVGGAE